MTQTSSCLFALNHWKVQAPPPHHVFLDFLFRWGRASLLVRSLLMSVVKKTVYRILVVFYFAIFSNIKSFTLSIMPVNSVINHMGKKA